MLFKSNILRNLNNAELWRGGQGLCRYDTIGIVGTRSGGLPALLILLLCGVPLTAQSAGQDPVTVSADHPRLLLRPARLRLLRRERQRTSARWQQLQLFIAGHAPLPEPAFAEALYYQVSGDAAAGKRAIAAALGGSSDLRQQALVFDWCQDLLNDAQRRELTARLEKGLAEPPSDSIPATRSRAFAAIALYDHVPEIPQRELNRIVHTWWQGKMVPAIEQGRNAIPREDEYPLFELLHAIRDTANLDLRDACPRFFRDLPLAHLMSYYPAIYQAPENDYRIGVSPKVGPPDLRQAALSRAAGLAMVAYDVNAQETQYLQGWLMHDRFILRGTFGAPYEFLWANPYQPGLSYFLVPLVYHNTDTGKLFVRSSWDDTAEWFGYFDGVMQMFADGRVTVLDPRLLAKPSSLQGAVVCFGASTGKFQVNLTEEQEVFILGLKPKAPYLVEIDDEEMFEAPADTGGILELTDVPHGKPIGIRLKPE